MSYLTAFCNITTDLQAIVSDIDRYDRKRVLMSNWSNPSSNLYRLSNTGYIENLYKDGVEMTKVTDTPNADNEFKYSESTDSVDFFLASSSVAALNSSVFEAGQDWEDLKTRVVKEQADHMRSFLNRPIYKRGNSNYQGAAGTFSPGTASTVKYDVFTKDDTGLRRHKSVDAEVMNGDYQALAYGALIRFQAGVYTAADEWSITFQSDDVQMGTVRSGQIYR
jgi:hypothetical protein